MWTKLLLTFLLGCGSGVMLTAFFGRKTLLKTNDLMHVVHGALMRIEFVVNSMSRHVRDVRNAVNKDVGFNDPAAKLQDAQNWIGRNEGLNWAGSKSTETGNQVPPPNGTKS